MAGKPELNIGLLWHSLRSGNLGVGALTLGNIALVEEAATTANVTPNYVVLGPLDEPADGQIDEIPFVGINGRNLFGSAVFLNQVRSLDCVLDIGAGDSFADIYGAKRFAYLWATKAITIASGTPLVLSPQTIGPFSRHWTRILSGWAINKSWATVCRDPISLDYARQLAPGANCLESTDVAFRLPFTRRAPQPDGTVHIGLNVSGLLWDQARSGRNSFGLSYDYPAVMRRLLTTLTADKSYTVELVTHANSDSRQDDDAHVADELAREFPRCHRVPNFTDPSAAKSYISGLDFLIAARMHACIAAFSAGVPVLPVAYSRKFQGLFEGVLQYHHVLPYSDIADDAALAFIKARLANISSLRREVDAGNRAIEPMIQDYVSCLARLFAGLVKR